MDSAIQGFQNDTNFLVVAPQLWKLWGGGTPTSSLPLPYRHKVLEAEPIRMKLAFSFTKKAKAPQYHLKRVFKLLCTLAVKEECKTALNKICIAAEELATRRQNNASVQYLLVRILAVVYERLSLSDRAIAQTQINQACSHLPDITVCGPSPFRWNPIPAKMMSMRTLFFVFA